MVVTVAGEDVSILLLVLILRTRSGVRVGGQIFGLKCSCSR
jgi:hypothetical protein